MFTLVKKSKEAPLRKVCILGVGDGGIRVVEAMQGDVGDDVIWAAINTDPDRLKQTSVPVRLHIGSRIEGKNGTGGQPSVARLAAEDDLEMIRGLMTDCDALILVTCLGGGTGTGAAPVVLAAARASGLFAMAIVTMPFAFEGETHIATAKQGLPVLTAAADFTACIPNERLFEASGGNDAHLEKAFRQANEAMMAAVCSAWHMLSKPMLIGLDLATFRAFSSKGTGACVFGFGTASGPGRAVKAAEALIEGSVCKEGELLASAGAAMVCVCGSYDMTLREVDDAVRMITAKLPEGADIDVATVIHEEWRDRLFVSVYLADRRRTVASSSRATDKRRVSDKPHAVKLSRPSKDAQAELQFDGTESVRGSGRFNKVAATMLDGENLDTPTFIRRGIALDKS